MFSSSVASKKVFAEYYSLIKYFETEFNILIEAKKEDLIKATDEKIADAIIAVREGEVKIKPGYDGVYGQLVFENSEAKIIKDKKQQGLDKFF